MKKYDYTKALAKIEEQKDTIASASLGMSEDWFWTGEEVFDGTDFVKDLTAPDLEIAGISGSHWATPTLQIRYKSGKELQEPCYTGESTGSRPFWL